MRGGRDDDKLMIATGGQTVQHDAVGGVVGVGLAGDDQQRRAAQARDRWSGGDAMIV